MSPASTSSAAPFACAERISERRSPKVRLPPAGRAARRSTINDIASAPASVSMCAASERSASECASTPATTSPTMNTTISARARPRRRASSPPPCECPCAWSCTSQSCRRAHHLVRELLPPLPRALELALLQRARSARDEEALGLHGELVPVLAQPPGDSPGRRADEQDRLVRARVEDRHARAAGAVR